MSCVLLGGWLIYICLKKDVYGFVMSVISWIEIFGFCGVMFYYWFKVWLWFDLCLIRVLYIVGICNVVIFVYLL